MSATVLKWVGVWALGIIMIWILKAIIADAVAQGIAQAKAAELEAIRPRSPRTIE